MHSAVRQRTLARVALAGSAIAGVVAFGYFALQGDVVTGLVAAVAFAGIGALEYRRQLRDLEVAGAGGDREPLERRP